MAGVAMVATLSNPSRVRAEETETVCEDSRVRIQGKPEVRWLEPIVRSCEALRTMEDVDGTARVRIVPSGNELIVEVALRDGRSTLRRVKEPAGLLPTLEALLTVLPAPTVEVPKTETAGLAHANDVAPTKAVPSPAVIVASEPTAPPFSVEIGASAGGRVAGSKAYLSVAPAVFAQLRAGEWLFGMHARWDILQVLEKTPVSGFEMETIAVGLSVSRRLTIPLGSVDIGLSPRVVAETQSFLVKGSEQADTQADVRIGAYSRAAFGHSSLRLFVELDADLSPGRARRDIRIDPSLPPLPSWSAGLGAGVVWGKL